MRIPAILTTLIEEEVRLEPFYTKDVTVSTKTMKEIFKKSPAIDVSDYYGTFMALVFSFNEGSEYLRNRLERINKFVSECDALSHRMFRQKCEIVY